MIDIRFVLYDAFTRTSRVLADSLELIEYRPMPAPVLVTYSAGMREAAAAARADIGNVEEEVRLRALCDTAGTLHKIVAALNLARTLALDERNDTHVLMQVRDPARHPNWFDADVLDGRCELEDGSGRLLTATITRHSYWRGTERIVRLRNTSGAGLSRVVFNHSDTHAGHNNFVLIDEQIGGTVPADTVIRATNRNEPQRIATVWVGWSAMPQSFTVEGEAADDTYPFGIIANTTLSNHAAATAPTLRWALPNNSLTDYVGGYRVLAFGDLSGDRWRIEAGYLITPYARLAEVQGGRGITDLGTLVLPVGGYVSPGRAETKVWLRSATGQAGEIDFLLFLPTAQLRQWKLRSYYVIEGACLEDNGVTGELAYLINEESYPIVAGYGEQIRLHPTRYLPRTQEQMLTFAVSDALGRADALTEMEIQVKVRERWDVLP